MCLLRRVSIAFCRHSSVTAVVAAAVVVAAVVVAAVAKVAAVAAVVAALGHERER